MASNNYIYKMSNAGGMSTVTRYVDMLAGNTTWNPWEPAGAYDALATVTVPSGGAASITFAGIPTGYKHLQIRGIARAASGGVNAIAIRLNGDTGANYAWHLLYGVGSGSALSTSAASTATALMSYQANPTNDGTGVFGPSVTDILDYSSTTKNKTIRNLSGRDGNGTGEIGMWSALWNNQNAVNSVALVSSGANFAEFSQFALYGVK
jgi:hypothetical protein